MGETVTMTIAEFLLARIDEDEAQARRAFADRRRDLDRVAWIQGSQHEPSETFLQAWEDHPGPLVIVGIERVLAECAAKRRIVDLAVDAEKHTRIDLPKNYMRATLRALASVHADHPDYRAEWAS